MFRKLLPLLMALQILCAYTHCVMAHGAELHQRVAEHTAGQAPLEGGESCENESACICKGVILADIRVELPADTVLHWLALDATGLSALDAVTLEPPENRTPDPPPVPSGNTMRAKLQVFLL
jgi:hypothetical protein